MNKLNVYLLKRKNGSINHDEMVGFVIVAKDEGEAREMANDACADEGKIWGCVARCTAVDGSYVSCKLVGTATTTEPEILLSDFNAG